MQHMWTHIAHVGNNLQVFDYKGSESKIHTMDDKIHYRNTMHNGGVVASHFLGCNVPCFSTSCGLIVVVWTSGLQVDVPT